MTGELRYRPARSSSGLCIRGVYPLGNERISITREHIVFDDGALRCVGTNLSVFFTLQARAEVVWPILQDFNLWQGEFGHHYSGGFEQREGELVYLDATTGSADVQPERLLYFIVRHVIPRHLIVLEEPVMEVKGRKRSGRHHIAMVEVAGATHVTALFQHVLGAAGLDVESVLKTHEQGIIRDSTGRLTHKWALQFEPKLRALVDDAARRAQ